MLFYMDTWIAEYTRGPLLFNIKELKAATQADAECQAWDGFMHLADCLTVSVRKFMVPEQNQTSLSERREMAQTKGKSKMKRMAA